MSRTIKVGDDPSKLSEADKRYLHERGRLPEGVEPPVLNTTIAPNSAAGARLTTNTGDANTAALSTRDLEKLLDERRAAEKAEAEANMEKDKEMRSAMEVADNDDADLDEEEDYIEGWNNDERRAELARRGLTTDGDKDTLIKRLVANDRGQSTA